MDFSITGIILWGCVGLFTGLTLGWSQWKTTSSVSNQDPNKIITTAYLLSFIRIICAAVILFLAFRQDLGSGLAALFTFIFGRWIWTILLVKRISKQEGS